MQHSIISWDSTFRNFFHLVDGLADQDFDRNEFELIYVEQRTQSTADQYNHSLGLRSLADRLDEIGCSMNLQVIYLDDPLQVPYHLGKCVNEGLKSAHGDIITLMDGDQLLPSDFLRKLSAFHEGRIAIGNLLRVDCQHPSKYGLGEDWTKAPVDFEFYRKILFRGKEPSIPATVNNKNPMISARREYWDATAGYDPHPLWSTSASRVGYDFNIRLEIAAGVTAQALNTHSIHPFHPAGFAKRTRTRDSAVMAYMSLQTLLIGYARTHSIIDHSDRRSKADHLYEFYHDLVTTVMEDEFLDFKANQQHQIRERIVRRYGLDERETPTLVDLRDDGKPENLALFKPCKQSSTSRYSKPDDAQGAVNGNKTGSFSFHTQSEVRPWWQVDLLKEHEIAEVRVYNRLGQCASRLETLEIQVSSDDIGWRRIYKHDPERGPIGGIKGPPPLVVSINPAVTARFVRLQLAGENALHVDEVEVFGPC